MHSQPETADAIGIRYLPPLHCLLAFEAAARHASLAKAAGELRVSVSALAQSIATLEERLGLKLVRALVPTVEPTASGQQYLRAVQGFVHRLRDGLFERFAAGRTQLRITASQALSRLWLAPRLGSFVQRHPRIDLVVTTTERLEPLKGGGVDVALRYGGEVDDELVCLPLWHDELVAVAAPAWAARADGLSPQAIAQTLPLVDHPVAGWRRWLDGLADAADPPLPRLHCTDLHLAIEAAAQGLGITISPLRVLARPLAAGELKLVSSRRVPARAYQAITSREQAQRAVVQAFVGWLAEQALGSHQVS